MSKSYLFTSYNLRVFILTVKRDKSWISDVNLRKMVVNVQYYILVKHATLQYMHLQYNFRLCTYRIQKCIHIPAFIYDENLFFSRFFFTFPIFMCNKKKRANIPFSTRISCRWFDTEYCLLFGWSLIRVCHMKIK